MKKLCEVQKLFDYEDYDGCKKLLSEILQAKPDLQQAVLLSQKLEKILKVRADITNLFDKAKSKYHNSDYSNASKTLTDLIFQIDEADVTDSLIRAYDDQARALKQSVDNAIAEQKRQDAVTVTVDKVQQGQGDWHDYWDVSFTVRNNSKQTIEDIKLNISLLDSNRQVIKSTDTTAYVLFSGQTKQITVHFWHSGNTAYGKVTILSWQYK